MTNDQSLVDMAAAISRLGEDEELYRELVVVFAEDAPRQITGLRAALSSDDAKESHRFVHSLKGAALNVGAEGLAFTAKGLEQLARDGKLDAVAAGLPGLVQALEKTIAHFVGEGILASETER